MIRTMTTAILAAFVLAGMALAQTAVPPGTRPPDPPVTVPPNTPAVPLPPPLVPDGPLVADDTCLWGRVSAMAGWTKGDLLPVLVTTSPVGTPRASAGIFPSNTTTPLVGGKNVNEETRGGLDFQMGYWLDAKHEAGIEAGFFFLGGISTDFAGSSNGTPILARPYTDVTTTTLASSLIAFPGVASGSIQVSENARQVWSGQIDLTETWCCCCGWRFESLLGYRYFRYDERLEIAQSVNALAGPFVPGTNVRSADLFSTGNIFNGVDLGLRGTFAFDPFSIELLGKVPAGYLTRNRSISGETTATVPGFAPVTSAGGLLALASNSGAHNDHTLTAMPEVGAQLTWDVNHHLRFQIGYDTLWLLRAFRPGPQIDTGINPTQIPPGAPVTTGTLARPTVLLDARDFWVQTVSLGIEFRY